MIYSDKAIISCLKIRYLFGLKLRQTQGFIDWMFLVSGIKLKCPDYTTLSKRQKKLNLEGVLGKTDEEFDCVCIKVVLFVRTGLQRF